MKRSTLIFLAVTTIYAYAQSSCGLTSSLPTAPQSDSIPTTSQKNVIGQPLHFELKYQLNAPDETFELPEELNEISGLGFDATFEKLYAVQDENGIIFIIDKKTGKVEEEIKFHKDGDYEGIEVVGDNVYVVKSTGTIYEVTNVGKDDQELEKYNSFLSRENDVEGLGFDAATNRLLLACKGAAATGQSFEAVRYKKAVYGFNLKTKEIDSLPVYNIHLDAIERCLHTTTTIKDTAQLTACFAQKDDGLNFNPSAIAVHPITKNIYVFSSSGKTMIVLNYEGEIIYIEKLDKKIHRQPEGIAFDADGTLYISNEKKGDPAKIYKFEYKE